MKSYKHYLLVFFALLSLGSCKSQYFHLGQNAVESSFPYSITYPDKLKMSKDLTGISDSGNLVLHFYISTEGNIADLDIVLASMFKDGKRVLRFSNPSLKKASLTSYPLELLDFYKYFQEQIGKFKITSKKGGDFEGEHLFRVPLTFSKN